MFEQLESVEKRYEEITEQMARPEVATNPNLIRELSTEQSKLEDLVMSYRKYREIGKGLAEAREILKESDDEELKELASLELEELTEQESDQAARLKVLILPRDPNDSKNTVIEVRAGAGGDEAALFAADLFRMYSKFAESIGATIEMLGSSPTGIGGFKEVIFLVKGKDVFSHTKYESGVHRVQRIPETESSGRIHTSTATVAVLPEAEEVDISIEEKDLRIDVCR